MADKHTRSAAGGLPSTVRLFPLDGVILSPGAHLPLHIFEPRYRQMIRDAIDDDQTIAMIQPRNGTQNPDLFDIGSVGRMVGCEETADGRFLIVLLGLSRFQMARELPVNTPYRQADVDYTAFPDDQQPQGAIDEVTRARLKAGIGKLLEQKGTQVETGWINTVSDADLVNRMVSLFPFTTAIRQAILEAPTLSDRALTLGRCMQFSLTSPEADTSGQLQ